MRVKGLLILTILMMSLCSCETQRRINAFREDDSIKLQVAGKDQFRYDPLSCQMAFSRSKKEFRAHTDNMSDFYIVRLSAIPVEQGEVVTADLEWTTDTDILSRNKLTLEVVRLEGDKMWLWSNSGRIGISLVVLE